MIESSVDPMVMITVDDDWAGIFDGSVVSYIQEGENRDIRLGDTVCFTLVDHDGEKEDSFLVTVFKIELCSFSELRCNKIMESTSSYGSLNYFFLRLRKLFPNASHDDVFTVITWGYKYD